MEASPVLRLQSATGFKMRQRLQVNDASLLQWLDVWIRVTSKFALLFSNQSLLCYIWNHSNLNRHLLSVDTAYIYHIQQSSWIFSEDLHRKHLWPIHAEHSRVLVTSSWPSPNTKSFPRSLQIFRNQFIYQHHVLWCLPMGFSGEVLRHNLPHEPLHVISRSARNNLQFWMNKCNQFVLPGSGQCKTMVF